MIYVFCTLYSDVRNQQYLSNIVSGSGDFSDHLKTKLIQLIEVLQNMGEAYYLLMCATSHQKRFEYVFSCNTYHCLLVWYTIFYVL